MKITDCHVHIGNDYYYNRKTDRKISLSESRLLDLMRKNGVEKSVIFPCPSVRELTCENKNCKSYGLSPTCLSVHEDHYILECPLCKGRWKIKENPYHKENEKIIGIGKRNKDLLPFIIIDPRYPKNVKCLNDYIEKGIIGVKIHPFVTNFSPKKLAKTEIMDIVKENGLVFISHSGEDENSLPSNIIELARCYPSVSFIIAHCARLDTGVLENARKTKNVFVETSLLDRFAAKTKKNCKDVYDFLIKTLGAEKILFGTDLPYITEEKYMNVVKSFMNLDFNDDTLKKIGSENIEILLNQG
ncbi:MAG: amidohydrolase family protein [Candidatus Aenigmatarchaeota archaeon]